MVAKKKATTTKRTSVRKSSASKAPVYQTFKVASDFPTFFHARLSRQTFYWSILLLFIIIMQLIIISINVNATITFDSIAY